MDEASRHQVELVLHRAARWRRQHIADYDDDHPDWEDDETFRLIRDLDNLLRTAVKEEP